VDQSVPLPTFLKYSLKNQEARSYFYRVAKQTTKLASVNLTQSTDLEIPLPLKVQKQVLAEIEACLSESDHLLAIINQQLTKADVLRQSILQHAFRGTL